MILFDKVSTSLLDPFVRELNNMFDPFTCKIRKHILKIRSLVFGSCLDGAEIPKALNIFTHKGLERCHLCDLIGSSLRHTVYHNRFSNEEIRTSPYTRRYRGYLLNRIGTNQSCGVFKGNSNFIDHLKSWFPMSTCFIDSLHVVYEGSMVTLLSLLQKKYPVNFI